MSRNIIPSNKESLIWAGIVAVTMIFVLVAVCFGSDKLHKNLPWQSWTLQGQTSHIGCPKQHIETVTVLTQDGERTFFLGCYGKSDTYRKSLNRKVK